MRTKDILFGFNSIAVLLQFLYMDESNTILINNGLCDLQIRMNEDCHFLCRNMNFPDHETNFDSDMTICFLQDIAEYLKSVPAVEYPKIFKSRWEEIENITSMNLSLNKT